MSDNKNRYYDDYRNIHMDEQSFEDRQRSKDQYDRAIQKKKIFGFEIFIDNDILQELGDPESFFSTIKTEAKTERIKFNPDLTIPDLQGKNVQIYDKSMQAKYQSAKLLLSHVHQKFKKLKNENFSIIIFVPQGMVSLLIGTKGHQINKIMKESKTVIVVNQPINRMTYRTVKIQGHHHDIARACRIIYQILQQKSTIAYTIQKQPNPLDYTKSKVTIKLILSTGVINYLQNKKKKFVKMAEDETHCSIRFKEEHNRLLKRDEDMCVIIGRLEDVQAIIILILTVINNYYIDEKDGEDYTLKMLIPSNYVTKLIGQKGYMIKGITDKSGALIKIQSDKQSETRECIIAIIGTRQNKIDATCFILEQIECFKNGGPILQSGKSINQNLAQQFKNSIPLRSYEADQGVKIENQKKKVQIEQTKMQEQVTIKKQIAEELTKQTIKQTKQQSLTDGRLELGQVKKQPVIPKKKYSSSSDSSSESVSESRSRSRDRKLKVSDRIKNDVTQPYKRKKSPSAQKPYRSQKIMDLKLVIPRRLCNDHKQLKYIQQLSNVEIIVSQQKVQSEEGVIIVRGSIKDNNQCMRLLMKRLPRYSNEKK